jgi:eukaryotic-like serine/threonine-protein kinase
MKRCPECRRDYTDETLNFCLDDGAQLLDGPGSLEPPTAVISGSGEDRGLATRRFSSTTGDTDVLRVSDATRAPMPPAGQKKLFIAAASVALFAALAAIGYLVFRSTPQADNMRSAIKLEKVTTDGKTSAVAISPDGKYAVYNVDAGGGQSLWTRLIATASPVQIIPPTPGVEYAGIRFTPDGNFVTFRRRDVGKTLFSLYQVPVLGGAQKKLLDDIDGKIAFSPDGKQFAFIRGNAPEMGESTVVVANADGSNQRILAKRKRPETFPWWNQGTVAWAPDGRTLIVVIGGSTTGGVPMELAEVSLEDGTVKPFGKQGWYEAREIEWLPNQSGILVMGAEKATDFYSQQISLVSYPSGETRRVTNDFNNYISMSLTADGKALAAVQSTRISNIWIVPNADTNRAVQIKSGGTNQEGTDGLAWAPDGRIVFYSKARGPDDIWIMNNDGSDPKPLTIDAGTNYDLKVTPDGRYIVFSSERGGPPNIWRMDLDGGNPKQLSSGRGEYGVSVTPDSQWVLFDSTASGTQAIWKVSIDGGEPTPLITRFTENSEISPDGKSIVCLFRENANAQWRYAVFSIDGGDPIKVFDLPAERGDVRWTPDGRGLGFTRTTDGVANIWTRPLDGGPDKQITNFKTDQIFNFKWSPDGRSLVLARGSVLSDVVMIRDFK